MSPHRTAGTSRRVRPPHRVLSPAAASVVGVLAAAAALVGLLSPTGFLRGEPVRFGLGTGSAAVEASAVGDDTPAITGLDPELRAALQRAAADAEDEDVSIEVNSGWRSAEHQARLLEEAVARYGSKEEAARWVAPPDRSAHVSGDAVDVGPSSAANWLGERGAAYGLCRIYRNEPWHFELRPGAVHHGCPRMYHDPTEDPRLQ